MMKEVLHVVLLDHQAPHLTLLMKPLTSMYIHVQHAHTLM